MQGLFESFYHHAAAVGTHINDIEPFLLDDKLLEDVDMYKYRRSSSKEGSASLVTLRDIPMVS